MKSTTTTCRLARPAAALGVAALLVSGCAGANAQQNVSSARSSLAQTTSVSFSRT